MHRPPFTHQEDSWYPFLLQTESKNKHAQGDDVLSTGYLKLNGFTHTHTHTHTHTRARARAQTRTYIYAGLV
jgi:hypothetical protein